MKNKQPYKFKEQTPPEFVIVPGIPAIEVLRLEVINNLIKKNKFRNAHDLLVIEHNKATAFYRKDGHTVSI